MICWFCATGWKSRLPTFSVHINILKGFGIVLEYSVPSWRTNSLGREHILWVGGRVCFAFPSGFVQHSPQKTESIVQCFCC